MHKFFRDMENADNPDDIKQLEDMKPDTVSITIIQVCPILYSKQHHLKKKYEYLQLWH